VPEVRVKFQSGSLAKKNLSENERIPLRGAVRPGIRSGVWFSLAGLAKESQTTTRSRSLHHKEVTMKMQMIPTLVLSFGLLASLEAAAPFTGAYMQDFDSMGPTGTELPEGWSGSNHRNDPATPLALGVTHGTTTSGGLYNVGAAGDADRALGSLATGTVWPRFGAQFQNTSDEVYTDLQLGGVMEQWRRGSDASVIEVTEFEYSFDARHIDDADAIWHRLTGMDLVERLVDSTTAGAVNGNDPANQLVLSGFIHDVNWLQDGVFTIRWTDFDHPGSDGLYALDQFTLTAVPEPSTYALLGLGALGWLARRWRVSRV
jgi:trimeric autotransporter adhesin